MRHKADESSLTLEISFTAMDLSRMSANYSYIVAPGYELFQCFRHVSSCNTYDLLQVTVNSGGVVFFALFSSSTDLSTHEAAAVIKIASSRMATQSERLGYEFGKWLGVHTPQVYTFTFIIKSLSFHNK